MAVAASTILTRVRDQLADSRTIKRWTDAELLRWLSDGQRTIVVARPSASATLSTITCVTGTRQTIPNDGYTLLKVYRNAAGTSDAVVEVTHDELDWQYPDRHSMTAVNTVKAYCFDPSDLAAFYVYPPATTSAQLTLLYSKMPVELTATSDNIGVHDIYQTALIDYVLYRAHSKDSDFAGGRETAAAYLAAFTAFISSMGAAAPAKGA